MKKNLFFIIGTAFSLVLVLLVLFFVGTGFTKNSNVEIINYSINEDGTELKFIIGITNSFGYTRCFKDMGGGVKSHYLDFYNTFGAGFISLGAKYDYVLELDEDDTEIYFNRNDEGYELVLQKNEITGEWERPNK